MSLALFRCQNRVVFVTPSSSKVDLFLLQICSENTLAILFLACPFFPNVFMCVCMIISFFSNQFMRSAYLNLVNLCAGNLRVRSRSQVTPVACDSRDPFFGPRSAKTDTFNNLASRGPVVHRALGGFNLNPAERRLLSHSISAFTVGRKVD